MATSTNSHQVTQEMLDRCERIVNENTGEVFYIVESQSKPGTHYKVIYNREHKCLQCLPFDGEPCPASLQSMTCWHMKAAFFHAKALRDERREQAAIESLVREGVSREEATRMIYANEHPAVYTEAQIKQAQYRNQPNAFSILR